MRISCNRAWLPAVAFTLLASLSCTTRAAALPTGFSDSLIARPDGRTWDNAAGIAAAADGRTLVWERTGRVWIASGTAANAEPLIDLSDEVSTVGALGLTGFALDPLFESNGYIYLFYAVEPEQLANCVSPVSGASACRSTYRAGTHATSGVTLGRLVRYQLFRPLGSSDYSAATKVNYSSRRVLLGESLAGTPSGCVVTDTAHGPGGLVFGSDGTLLAGCGDGASANTEDSGSNPHTQFQQALNAGLMTTAENVGAFRAQLVNSLSGKILRLDAATGDGVASNPFYDPAAPRAARSRVWLLGLHDPQHFAVRPGSGSTQEADGHPGTLYIGDLGLNNWESLAVARDGRMNFGWPLYEGVGNNTTDYADLAAFNLEAPNPQFQNGCQQKYFQFRDLISADPLRASWPNPCQMSIRVPAAEDLFVRDRPAIDWWHGGADARWAGADDSGEPLALELGARAPNGALVTGPAFGGTVSVGGVWHLGSSFPVPFRNQYYHADSGGQWIKAFAFDANDDPVAVRDFLADGGPIRALGDDPQTGNLYYISGLSGSEVHKLTYTPKVAPAPAATAPTIQTPAGSTQPAGREPISAPPLFTGSIRAPFALLVPAPVHKPLSALKLVTQIPAQSGAPGWSDTDIGAVAAVGSYSFSNGAYTVNGSGADVWGTADEFQFVYEPLSGNGSITAEVVSQTNSNVWAKAGVMFRETLATGATNAFVAVTPSNGSVFQDRPTTGGSSNSASGPVVKAPYWVRVVRSGNTFTGYVSPDGNTWTQITSYTFTMATNAYIGLAVSSHNNGTLSTAVFDSITITGQVQSPLNVSPPIAGITLWQTQQFTATVPGGGGATWTVDGVANGNSTVGLISSSGLYTPGTEVGAHNIVATSIANTSLSGSAVVGVTNLAGVYTYHNDIARDGANTQEYALTPANVNSATFGKLFSCTADGAIYGQPLWVANLTVNGAPHNVVLVATQHDSVFAFDADTSPCVTLWSASLIDSNHGGLGGETSVPSGTTGYLVGSGLGDITPEVGVTGTPVFDPGTNTLYVVSKSVSSTQTTIYQRLHAIDPTTGLEKTGSPVTIAGSYPGTGTGGTTVAFSPKQQNQRPGLAFVNGTVYIAWASHEDTGPWYGWMMGYTYNGSSFTQASIFNAAPNTGLAGIWMSGGAPAADSNNNLYVVTGNGNFDASSGSKPNNDYGDSLLQLNSALSVSQYFTPSDQANDYSTDDDFGSGGTAVLANLPAGSPVLHLLMCGGKDGSIYALDRDLLGGYGDSFSVQKIVLGNAVFSTGAYWNDYYFVAGSGGPLTAFLLNTTVPAFSLAAKAPTGINFPGSTPSVSASATQNGIVWAMDNSRYCTEQSNGCGPTVLHAYNATNVANELWNSSIVSTDAAGNAVKFTVPTVANGKVYVGDRGNNTGGVYGSTTVSGQLDVYGLKP